MASKVPDKLREMLMREAEERLTAARQSLAEATADLRRALGRIQRLTVIKGGRS